MIEAELISRRLKERFGLDVSSLRPKYRLVFADSQEELRHGLFNDYFGSGPGKIFLREFKGVRKAPKYPYLKGQYVLEKLVFQPVTELPESWNGHYELLWAFPAELPASLKACFYVIYRDMNKKRVIRSAFEQEDAEDKIKEKQLIMEMWEDDLPYLSGMIRDGHATVISNTDSWER